MLKIIKESCYSDLCIPKGTKFIRYEDGWFDDINFGFGELSDGWADENLENITSVKN